MSIPFSVVGARAAVTGAGSGIGRAICAALAKKGALSILALDVDSESAQETARLCQKISPVCAAEAAHCDASNSASLRAVLKSTPVDLFCANAGVATVGDCSVPDSEWLSTWNLNVMQLVWATDELVPVWRERGTGGGLLVTASAAGFPHCFAKWAEHTSTAQLPGLVGYSPIARRSFRP